VPSTPEVTAQAGLGAIFTVLFVTLGPLKILGPFAHLTRDADEPTMRRIAALAFTFAVIAVLAGGFVGRALLHNWHVSVAALLLAGGTVFFLIGLSLVLEQYQPAHAAAPPLPASTVAAAMPITFPTLVTPYGVAALIVLLASSHDAARTASIIAIASGVMVLNLLAMLYASRSMGGVTLMVLQILGTVLGVLQIALALELMVRGLRGLGVLHG
jgi:multiple antibiotic resistance protein